MHQSIATIDSPEFINLQPLDINPLMSSCEIKVLYLNENRNGSYISKEVATKMSKTLRGAPIVGYYRDSKQDFADHGDVVTIDDEGIHFECKTIPYGFVAPDAKVWFQKFEDYDDFGNTIVREYLMTTGYLWTGQFEECALPLEQGRPQSMELDEKTLDGKWSTSVKTNMEFFIINDAIFSKLCILGNDVEPCFEGANITVPKFSKSCILDNDAEPNSKSTDVAAPNVSTDFIVDADFKNTLFSMMQDLKNFVLEGGKEMEVENNQILTDQNLYDEKAALTEETETSFKKKTEEEEKEAPKEEQDTPSTNEDKEVEDKEDDASDKEEEDDEDKKKKASTKSSLQEYELLQANYNKLKEDYNNLKVQYDELVEFKNQIENEKKDELINSFYMLSDEEKKDVIENKSTYSYDEIEAKLSVLYVRNKVNFDLEDTSENKDKLEEETPVTTFNLNEQESGVPAWVQALRDARKENN